MRKPPYVHEFKDRHGRVRAYLRKPGCKPVALPGVVWTPTFMAAYEAALLGLAPPSKRKGATADKTLTDLVTIYYAGSEFGDLADTTKATYRGILGRLVAEYGNEDVTKLTAENVSNLIAKKSKTPSAANNLLIRLHTLMNLAVTIKWRPDNPCFGVKPRKIRSNGFNTWSVEQIELFRAKHALGTRARLAIELLYSTIQRRSDVVRMGYQHVRSGTLSIRQQKTGELVEIPVLPDLAAVIALLPPRVVVPFPKAGRPFLETDEGKAFTAAGFGNWFRAVCNEAGIPVGYSAHGLRKAGATRLAEAGCTDLQIMAWGGWKTLKEVQRYTRAASRKRMAASAGVKLEAMK